MKSEDMAKKEEEARFIDEQIFFMFPKELLWIEAMRKQLSLFTHAGTCKTVIITFDNRNLMDSTMKNELMTIFRDFFHDPVIKG